MLPSLLLTDGDKCVRTTTFWVYEMTRAHLNKAAVKVSAQGGTLTAELPPLSVATRDREAGVRVVRNEATALILTRP